MPSLVYIYSYKIFSNLGLVAFFAMNRTVYTYSSISVVHPSNERRLWKCWSFTGID